MARNDYFIVAAGDAEILGKEIKPRLAHGKGQAGDIGAHAPAANEHILHLALSTAAAFGCHNFSRCEAAFFD